MLGERSVSLSLCSLQKLLWNGLASKKVLRFEMLTSKVLSCDVAHKNGDVIIFYLATKKWIQCVVLGMFFSHVVFVEVLVFRMLFRLPGLLWEGL